MSGRPRQFTLDRGHELAQGLVFAGLGRFSGSTHYHDSSLYGNSGTLTNMEPSSDWVWDSWLGRWAQDYDGTNDYSNHGTAGPLVEGAVSMSCWVYPRALTGNKGVFCRTSHPAPYVDYGFKLLNDGMLWYWYDTASRSLSLWTTQPTLGAWNHLFGVAVAGHQQVWLNGVSVKAGTNAGTPTSPADMTLCVGRYMYGTTNYFDGLISDCLMWKANMAAFMPALADPSNWSCSGLVRPPKRRIWAAVIAPAAGFKPYFVSRHRQPIGGGVI